MLPKAFGRLRKALKTRGSQRAWRRPFYGSGWRAWELRRGAPMMGCRSQRTTVDRGTYRGPQCKTCVQQRSARRTASLPRYPSRVHDTAPSPRRRVMSMYRAWIARWSGGGDRKRDGRRHRACAAARHGATGPEGEFRNGEKDWFSIRSARRGDDAVGPRRDTARRARAGWRTGGGRAGPERSRRRPRWWWRIRRADCPDALRRLHRLHEDLRREDVHELEWGDGCLVDR